MGWKMNKYFFFYYHYLSTLLYINIRRSQIEREKKNELRNRAQIDFSLFSYSAFYFIAETYESYRKLESEGRGNL